MKFYVKGMMIVLLAANVVLSGCSTKTENTSASRASENPASVSFAWKESTPREQGMKEDLLEQIDGEIRKNQTKLLSFLVVKNGYIVYEKYYQNRNKDTYTGVFSVNKSILSALTGIAIEKGFLKGTDQKVSDVLPELFTNQTDSRKKDITLRNVLTMTGGVEPVDNNIQSWFQSPDWLSGTIDKPMIQDPGTTFNYNTGLSHLLSGVLTKTTGMSTRAFADQYLFGPLNITNYDWERDPKGIYVGGTNLSLTPRDMAKFGYLYLHKGVWEGKQIVPKAWVEESVQKKIKADTNNDYGYYFWLKNLKDSQGKGVFAYEANGYGGQIIRVIPELDTVIVATSNHMSQEKGDYNYLINNYVIPAIR